MAEAVVQPRRPAQRFFCHRCNVEFEDVLQDYTCPYCSTGFIERLEHDDTFSSTIDDEEYSDADMSNLEDSSHLDDNVDDSDDMRAHLAAGQPMLNDLAFLMTGGRLRPGAGGRRGDIGRSLLEQLMWMMGGGRGAVTTAGAPFVLVGAPGDYVFGGEGLDAVVTQLLGQLENSGPPPLPRDQIQRIPIWKVSPAQVEAGLACSVCWDNFALGEMVSRLDCEHIFHPGCITPWLQLHATCPICRRSLLSESAAAAAAAAAAAPSPAAAPGAAPAPAPAGTTQEPRDATPAMMHPDIAFLRHNGGGFGRVVVRRMAPRRRRGTQAGAGSESSSSRGLWSALTSQIASATSDSASASGAASDRPSASSLGSDAMYMDIDFD